MIAPIAMLYLNLNLNSNPNLNLNSIFGRNLISTNMLSYENKYYGDNFITRSIIKHIIKIKSILIFTFAHNEFTKWLMEVYVISCIIFSVDLNLGLTRWWTCYIPLHLVFILLHTKAMKYIPQTAPKYMVWVVPKGWDKCHTLHMGNMSHSCQEGETYTTSYMTKNSFARVLGGEAYAIHSIKIISLCSALRRWSICHTLYNMISLLKFEEVRHMPYIW